MTKKPPLPGNFEKSVADGDRKTVARKRSEKNVGVLIVATIVVAKLTSAFGIPRSGKRRLPPVVKVCVEVRRAAKARLPPAGEAE
ncbi:unnamed protein product [Camellia sinensis]